MTLPRQLRPTWTNPFVSHDNQMITATRASPSLARTFHARSNWEEANTKLSASHVAGWTLPCVWAIYSHSFTQLGTTRQSTGMSFSVFDVSARI